MPFDDRYRIQNREHAARRSTIFCQFRLFDDRGEDVCKRRCFGHNQTGVFSKTISQQVIRSKAALFQHFGHGAFEKKEGGMGIEQPVKWVKSVGPFLINNIYQRLIDQWLRQFVAFFNKLAKDRFLPKQFASHLIVLGALSWEHPDTFSHGSRFKAASETGSSILIRRSSPVRTFPGPTSTNCGSGLCKSHSILSVQRTG